MRHTKYIRIWLSVNIPWLRDCLLTDRERLQLDIFEIRHFLRAFGCETSHLSDNELVEQVEEHRKAFSAAGITADELRDAANRLSSLDFR